jgi:hypothetical protein
MTARGVVEVKEGAIGYSCVSDKESIRGGVEENNSEDMKAG